MVLTFRRQSYSKGVVDPAMSLRISTTAERCAATGRGKVRFRIGGRCVIVEDLVLHRWRQRSGSARNGEGFDGCRLRPNTWRVLGLAADAGLSLISPISRDVLAGAVTSVRNADPRLKATQVDRLLQVIGYLQLREVLQAVIRRERSLANPGLPDLFLWRTDRTGVVKGGHFVEVKRQTVTPRRTREKLSAGQKSELEFLRSLGLRAKAIWITEIQSKRQACDCLNTAKRTSPLVEVGKKGK